MSKANSIPVSIDPSAIERFTLNNGYFEIKFHNESVLKWKARTTSYFSYEDGLQLGDFVFPQSVTSGSGVVIDGKPRCCTCRTLLVPDHKDIMHLSEMCWPCLKENVFDTSISMLESLGTPVKDCEATVRRAAAKITREQMDKLLPRDIEAQNKLCGLVLKYATNGRHFVDAEI